MRFVFIAPVVVVVQVIMWVFRVDPYTQQQFDDAIDRIEDMLNENYPERTMYVFFGCLASGFIASMLFSSADQNLDLTATTIADTLINWWPLLALIGLCVFGFIGGVCCYIEDPNYRIDHTMYVLWLVGFEVAVVISAVALGYFIVPALI